jgi:hypothetical protein
MPPRHQIARFVAMASLVVLLFGACSDDTSGGGVEAERQVLTRYVAAVAAGNFEAAMSQRCTAARLNEGEKSSFLSQAARLADAVGPISVASVRKADPPTGLRPVDSLPNPIEISYRLSARGSPIAGELHTVVVQEDGSPRLCGVSTETTGEEHAPFSRTGGDLGFSTRNLQEMIPPTPGAGYRQVEDAAGTLTKPGLQASWSRAWQFENYGGARVTVEKYETTEQAANSASELLYKNAGDGIEAFEVPGLAEAVGVRYLEYAWLWVQPPTKGPFFDRVVMRLGDRVVSASVANLPTGSSHEVAAGLATDIVRAARR